MCNVRNLRRNVRNMWCNMRSMRVIHHMLRRMLRGALRRMSAPHVAQLRRTVCMLRMVRMLRMLRMMRMLRRVSCCAECCAACCA